MLVISLYGGLALAAAAAALMATFNGNGEVWRNQGRVCVLRGSMVGFVGTVCAESSGSVCGGCGGVLVLSDRM